MGAGGVERGLRSVLLAASLALVGGLAGCVEAEEQGQGTGEIDEIDEVALGETEQSLSVLSWTAPAHIANTAWYPQVGTIGNRVIMVHSNSSRALFWRERVGVNGWSAPIQIPGTQVNRHKASLAAFNGFLYMVYTDINDAQKLWVARFDPTTSSWSGSFTIPHRSWAGPPAIASYNGSLQLIGVNPNDKKLWRATMSAGEAFTPEVPMDGHYSHSRVSAAVAQCKLYIAHRAGSGTNVVYNSFNGSGWTYDQTIPAGSGGVPLQALEPVIAERSGYLHLLHRGTSNVLADYPVWWTYFDGSSWPSQVSVGTSKTFYAPSMTNGGLGLVATVTPYYDSPLKTMEYSQALPPFQWPCFLEPGLAAP